MTHEEELRVLAADAAALRDKGLAAGPAECMEWFERFKRLLPPSERGCVLRLWDELPNASLMDAYLRWQVGARPALDGGEHA